MGAGASWAGAGILPAAAKQPAVDPLEQLMALSHELHPSWAARLQEQTGIDNGYRRCGGIHLATTAAEAATLAANSLWWQGQGVEHQQWTADQLVQHEPALEHFVSGGLRSAWYLPDECQLRNPRHLKALAAACQKLGVTLLPSTPMQHLDVQGGRIAGVEVADGRLQAERVCICSGAWARHALTELGFASGIMPVRGQMVLYGSQQQLLTRIVNEGNRYLVPRSDGRILAGSVEEEVGYTIANTPEAIASIRGWAERTVPALAQCEVERQWAGLRPGSFDGFPYLGRVPGIENLFVAAGHFRNGLHLSCGTAVVMAAEILGQPGPINMHPFRIGR
jgi:glycine oxidase